jgi:hypothetical protein
MRIADHPMAVDAMLHQERSPYACLGPADAPTGNAPHWMAAPALRRRDMPALELSLWDLWDLTDVQPELAWQQFSSDWNWATSDGGRHLNPSATPETPLRRFCCGWVARIAAAASRGGSQPPDACSPAPQTVDEGISPIIRTLTCRLPLLLLREGGLCKVGLVLLALRLRLQH